MNHRMMISACLVVLVTLTLLSRVSSAPHRDTELDLERLLKHINTVSGKSQAKRGCQGYMCSYSHMSGHAGKVAIDRAMKQLLLECAQNPNPACFEGKRRRRHAVAASQVRSSQFLALLGQKAS